MDITIHNVKGSSKISKEPPFPFTSWLKYWEAQANFDIKEGVSYNCPGCGRTITRKNFDGCHVQKVGLVDRKWYLIPLCDSCNHRTDMFTIDGNLLVPVPSNI